MIVILGKFKSIMTLKTKSNLTEKTVPY